MKDFRQERIFNALMTFEQLNFLNAESALARAENYKQAILVHVNFLKSEVAHSEEMVKQIDGQIAELKNVLRIDGEKHD